MKYFSLRTQSWTDLSPPGDHVVVPVVLVPADQGQLLPLTDVVGPGQRGEDKLRYRFTRSHCWNIYVVECESPMVHIMSFQSQH